MVGTGSCQLRSLGRNPDGECNTISHYKQSVIGIGIQPLSLTGTRSTSNHNSWISKLGNGPVRTSVYGVFLGLMAHNSK